MTSRALESEVELLNSEVTRLRLMVQRCNVAQQELGQKVRQGYANEGDAGGGGAVATQAFPHAVRIPQPDDPISVLPSLFSGMDGTARLFKVLLETYPWLLPADLREAQEELKRKMETSRHKKKKSSSRNPTPRQRKSKKRSPSSSSASSSSSEESSTSEEELPKSSGRSKQQQPVSPKPTASAVANSSATPPVRDSPRTGGGYDGGVGTGSVSPRSSGNIFSGSGTGAVLGFGRRSPGRQSPSSSSPAMSPTSTYTPLPNKAQTAKKASILDKIKHLGEDDEDGSSSDGDEKMYIPGHKRRATSAPSDDTSDKNSFVDETMKPANEEDEHDF